MKTITNLIYVAFAFASFAPLPTAKALPQSDTQLGKDALKSVTTGVNDTALGYQGLKSTTTGSGNTGTGSQALINNTTGSGNIAMLAGWQNR